MTQDMRWLNDRAIQNTHKFDIQVQDVVILIPVDLRASGKISLGRTNIVNNN